MAFITADAVFDSTAIDNIFFIDYMAGAPANALKVYLFMRMLCAHPELGGMDELCGMLSLSNEEFESSIDYWTRQGLIEKTSDNPPSYKLLPLHGEKSANKNDYYEFRNFNNSLGALFPDSERHMNPAQYKKAQEWLETGFSEEAVIALIKGTIAKSRSKNPYPASIFNTADKTAMLLADENALSRDAVNAYFEKAITADKIARSVIERLGMSRKPTVAETELARKWVNVWGLDKDTIIDACDKTIKAREPSFGYIDAILKALTPEGETITLSHEVISSLNAHMSVTPAVTEWYLKRKNEGFEHATLVYAASQQSKKRNNSLDALDWLLDKWKENGLFTASQAEEFVSSNRAMANELTDLLYPNGAARRLSEDEVYSYANFKKLLPFEVITYTSEQAIGKKDPVGFFLNRLKFLCDSEIHDIAAARKLSDIKYTTIDITNPARNYEQREYTPDSFSSSNFMDDIKPKGE